MCAQRGARWIWPTRSATPESDGARAGFGAFHGLHLVVVVDAAVPLFFEVLQVRREADGCQKDHGGTDDGGGDEPGPHSGVAGGRDENPEERQEEPGEDAD